MNDFRYGPVEYYLVGFEGRHPDPSIFGALDDLIDTGTVRLLDVVVLARSHDGGIETFDLEAGEVPGLSDLDPLVAGLAGDEDIEMLAEFVPAGSSAAIVVLELTFARALAEKLAQAGGEVLRTDRIPAPVVNAMMDILEQEGE
ncbi:DUF6325 family protein [Microbacterium sp. NPDC089320]|uniref:DUF6325 family protein n=1 Tax=Microbacterium sp. NPDC089320 TaxID=3155182 RepID=UPI00143BDFDE